ncbi:hypothetical protein FRC12_015699 [Ceratobasidium sp. 428]|nr:hypothetical protein FRC12_015699 [Ceratobasidium sp. 428]
MLRLSDLPSDIYVIILSHIPPPNRQQAVLNLSRALPRSPVPTHQIYEHIVVHTPNAVLNLYHIFRKHRGQGETPYNPSSQVQSLSIRTLTPDADLVVNLLALLPNVPDLRLSIGTTYGPEHLQDIFANPRLELRRLQLRFRPYVNQATYLPFLKGAYFDSIITELTKWPATEHKHLETLSIVQDTISYKTHIKFAQPMAFFSFKPLIDLAISPIGQHITSLRLSIPAKTVAQYLYDSPNAFPNLTFLDISTTSLPAISPKLSIEHLLSQLVRLQHIVIDRTAGAMPRDTPAWTSFGRTCALAGVARAKAREKVIQEWFEMRRREEVVEQAVNPEQAAVAERAVRPETRARRGRKGLATATISLRDPPPQPRSSTAAARSNVDDTTTLNTRRIRIVPSPPTLRTFSTAYAGPSNPTAQQRIDWTNAFTTGFIGGCQTLNAIWKRMQDSTTSRVMRFTETDTEPYTADDEDVLTGVADIAVVGHWIGWEPTIPIICFGTERSVPADGFSRMTVDTGEGDDDNRMSGTIGPSSVGGLWEDEEFVEWGPGHVDGCGHHIGRSIFES